MVLPLTVIALDSANAEDALLPIPKLFDSHTREKEFQDSSNVEFMDGLGRSSESVSMDIEGTIKIYLLF